MIKYDWRKNAAQRDYDSGGNDDTEGKISIILLEISINMRYKIEIKVINKSDDL